MPAPKGTRPPAAGIGRKKGSKNKLSSSVKEMILIALDKVGGAEYLARQAEENPNGFMSLLGKVLPVQEAAAGNLPVPRQTYQFNVSFPAPPDYAPRPQLIDGKLIDVTPKPVPNDAE
jgi:hypothetical protein